MEIKRNNQLFKKILAIFLTILMIATTIPLNVFAASSNMNLGEKDNNATISVKKETHYGTQIDALLHKQRSTHDSTVNSDQRQKDTQ